MDKQKTERRRRKRYPMEPQLSHCRGTLLMLLLLVTNDNQMGRSEGGDKRTSGEREGDFQILRILGALSDRNVICTFSQ
ncbi:hypothetical protein B9Z55_014645 [Caenorhabditis nigoni]|uniref:Uncharacterized protein n=1 Tax=Caenorhabditis nigoni TaxID=1611254 RepID=A0A2G5U6Q7_9PELO|nr:hypothetical protein B9Z55_014645 [Caenorhabditis nigoni]